MRFGVCMPIDRRELSQSSGFSILKVSVVGACRDDQEAQFADFAKMKPHPIHAEAAQKPCMFPGSMKADGRQCRFLKRSNVRQSRHGRLAQAGIKIGVSAAAAAVYRKTSARKSVGTIKTVAKSFR